MLAESMVWRQMWPANSMSKGLLTLVNEEPLGHFSHMPRFVFVWYPTLKTSSSITLHLCVCECAFVCVCACLCLVVRVVVVGGCFLFAYFLAVRQDCKCVKDAHFLIIIWLTLISTWYQSRWAQPAEYWRWKGTLLICAIKTASWCCSTVWF